MISFCIGEGEELLAAVHEKVLYVGFARSAKQVEVVRQHVTSVIILEFLDSVDDGFLERRFLSRARSVGGAELKPGAEPKPAAQSGDEAKPGAGTQPKPAAKSGDEPPAKKAKASKSSPSSSKSSSSCSE